MPRLSSLTNRGLTGIGLTGIGVSPPLLGTFSGLVVGVRGDFGTPIAIQGQTSSGTLSTFTNSTSSPVTTGNWINIASSDSVAMTVSRTGGAAVTSDGSTWTAVTSLPAFNPSTTNIVWAGLAYGAGTWVAVAGGVNAPSTQVAYSTDNGTSWTSINPLTSSRWTGVRYANGHFVANDGFTPGTAAYSTDGISWTMGATAITALVNNSVYYAEGSLNAWYAIRGISGAIRVQTSTNNGATWSAATDTPTGGMAGSTFSRWGNGVFVVILELSTTVWTSTDSLTWTATANAFGTDTNAAYFSSLVFTNGYFIATTSQFSSFTYNIWFSSNGTTWTKATTVGTNQISRLTGLSP
jgi:hypothetical protein